MPEDSTYDEIVQELVFNRMVERGLADADAGRVISDREMKRAIDQWRTTDPDAGLAGLAGGWEGSEDLLEVLSSSRRSRTRSTPKARR